MTARRLEGRPVAQAIWQFVEAEAASLATRHGRAPTLALVRGDDPAARAYARQIERSFVQHGMATGMHDAPSQADSLDDLLRSLSDDPAVDGVLILTPLPNNLRVADRVQALSTSKDVDGLHPLNAGLLAQRQEGFVPSTALGGIRLLEHYEVPLRGARVVVVGRSPVVGLPLALLALHRHATVSICHSQTPNLAELTRQGEVLCVAAGRAGLVGPDHVRPGAIVLDFGTNVAEDGSLVGDALPSVAEVAAALTPVPGGTGPVTVAVLAQQTIAAARRASLA